MRNETNGNAYFSPFIYFIQERTNPEISNADEDTSGWRLWLSGYTKTALRGLSALCFFMAGAWLYQSGGNAVEEVLTLETNRLQGMNPSGRSLLQSSSVGVVNSVGDQSINPNQFFEVVFDQNVFSFNNATELFYANASSANGDPLPAWVTFKHETPSLLGFGSSRNTASGIAVQDNHLYIGGDPVVTNQVLMIYDVTDPSQVSYLGNFSQAQGIVDIKVAGDIAYILSAGTSPGFRVLNVTDVSEPTLIGYAPMASNVKRFDLVGNKVYVVAWATGFQVVDINYNHSPQILGFYDCVGFCTDVKVIGNRAYVVGRGSQSGLDIVDISDDGNPILIKRFDYSAVTYSIDVQGKIAYIGQGDSVGSFIHGPGVSLVDISDELNPTVLSNITLSQPIRDIIVKGNLAYTVQASWFHIFDVSNRYYPRKLASRYVTQANRIVIDDNIAYISRANSGIGFNIYDLGGWKLLGTPTESDKGVYDICVQATSPGLGELEDCFQIVVGQLPPQLNKAIPDQLAIVDQFFNYFFDQNTFSDPNKDSILYSSTLQGQGTLPTWLSFNEVSGTFSGTARSTDVGIFTIEVAARDNIAGDVKTTFTLTVDNAPTISKLIASQKTRVGKAFEFQIDSNAFVDIDPGDTLTYQITLQSGQPLPAWLSFDASTLRLSGTPNDLETIPLKITATDDKGASNFMLFTIDVQPNHAPEVAIPIESKAVQINQAFQFIIPEETFSDPNGDVLTYSAQRSNGKSLPDWLQFEETSRQFSGKPGRSATRTYRDGEVTIALSASDGIETVIAHFKIFIQGESHAELAIKIGLPILSGLITLLGLYKKRAIFLNCWNKKKYQKEPVIAKVGQPFEHVMPDSGDQSYTVQAFQRRPKQHCSFFFRCCNSEYKYQPLPGGDKFPLWAEYSGPKSMLQNKSGLTPQEYDKGSTWIRRIDKNGEIKEEFELIVESDSASDSESNFVQNDCESDVEKAVELRELHSSGNDSGSSASSEVVVRPGTALFRLNRTGGSRLSQSSRPITSRSFRRVGVKDEERGLFSSSQPALW